MTHRSRRWGSRFARLASALVAVAVLGAGRLLAQGTGGKIEGFVRDQAGAPISGAQVLIVGSAFSATSNEQGYYFINNVPAGVMAVRAQYIGYAPAESRNVRVFSGQTMTVNLTLEQRAIEVAGITVTVETAPIVPRDQVTSRQIVQGDVVEQLPVDNVNQLLRLQPGVVQSARGLSIRGGRTNEAAVYIDGVLVRSVSGSTSTITVGTNALEEASITTGAIGAELGDAQSGVISFVTRSGGQRFRGSASYSTDELSGETYGQGAHRIETSLSGPVARNLTFFVGATMQGAQSARRGIGAEDVPLFVMDGIDTTVTVATRPGTANPDSVQVALPRFSRYSEGQRRPDDWGDAYTVDAKLAYSFGASSRVSATFHRTRNQGLNFRGGNLYNPQAQTGGRALSNALILSWNQSLTRSSENALSIDANFSIQSDEGIGGPVDQQWLNDNHTPFGWFSLGNMQFVVDRNSFPVDERLIQNRRVNNCQAGRDAARQTLGGCVPFIDRNDLTTAATYRLNPYGVSAVNFPQSGIGNVGITLNSESRVTGSAAFDWQANRYNRIKFGASFYRADVTVFNSGLISQIFSDAAQYSPTKVGIWLTDRLDLGDVVVDLGLRYDRLNSGISYPRVPGRLFTDPARVSDGNLPGALARARTAEDSAVTTRCNNLRIAADTAGWSTCNYFDAPARGVLAPTLRIGFPVTDRTTFRLSYSHQAQAPDFNLLARNVNSDLAFTNTNDIFSRDLDFGKTIQFEFGVTHAFSDDMVLNVAAYNKDKVSDATARILPVFDPFRNEVQNLNLLTNADFGNVRGIDVKLDRRIGTIFQGSLAYTFQAARNTGSDPFEYLNTVSRTTSNVTNERSPPPQALLRTRDDRTHTIAGSLSLNFPDEWRSGTLAGSLLENVGAFATFRFASGLAYTRMQNDGTGARGPGNNFGLSGINLEPLNSSSMPWIKNVDLRVTRGFQFGSRGVTVFADFRNLFNWTNLNQIFAETGNVTNSVHREQSVSPNRVSLANDAGTLVETRTINSQPVIGINLSDCSQYLPGAQRGLPDCLMLRRTETRFGDGDGFFTEAEQERAFNAFYDLNNGSYTLRGAGFNMRLGFEINF